MNRDIVRQYEDKTEIRNVQSVSCTHAQNPQKAECTMLVSALVEKVKDMR